MLTERGKLIYDAAMRLSDLQQQRANASPCGPSLLDIDISIAEIQLETLIEGRLSIGQDSVAFSGGSGGTSTLPSSMMIRAFQPPKMQPISGMKIDCLG